MFALFVCSGLSVWYESLVLGVFTPSHFPSIVITADCHVVLCTPLFLQDGKLSKEEILNKYDLFVGSQATDFGEALVRHDEF